MSRFKDGAGVGLRRAAEMLLEASNAAAPTESGHLVESSGVDVDQEGLEASIYYGPTSAPRRGKPVYAIVRHEALRQGGAPKYLERPVIRNRDRKSTRLNSSHVAISYAGFCSQKRNNSS